MAREEEEARQEQEVERLRRQMAALRQVGLAVQHRRGGGCLLLLLNLLPDGGQVPDVGLEVGLLQAVACGPNDEAEVTGPMPLDDLAQALPLLVRIDSA